jgi:hypothetical protein
MPRCHMPLTPLAAMYEHEPELGHVATDFAPVLRRLPTATLAVQRKRRQAAESVTAIDDKRRSPDMARDDD